MIVKIIKTVKIILIFSVLFIILLSGCSAQTENSDPKDDQSDEIELNSSKDITDFKFTSALNSSKGITADCTGIISGTDIALTIPSSVNGVNLNDIIPVFTTTGQSVSITGTAQTSGVTSNNFVNPVIYAANAEDGSVKNYTVTATLTVQTIKGQTDGDGFIQLYTNDTANFLKNISYMTNIIISPLNSFEVQAKKLNGDLNNSYGVNFCFQDFSNFYRFAITNNYYAIQKFQGGTGYYYNAGTWQSAKNFVLCAELNHGYNTINTLKVVNNGSGDFDFYINGTLIISINDTSFTGGDIGITMFSSDTEIFPNKPEDTRFKIITYN